MLSFSENGPSTGRVRQCRHRVSQMLTPCSLLKCVRCGTDGTFTSGILSCLDDAVPPLVGHSYAVRTLRLIGVVTSGITSVSFRSRSSRRLYLSRYQTC